ncbi:Protein ECM3 [[Candida] zeylanoides]
MVSLGTVVYSAVRPIFKIYFIFGLGFFLAKRNILTVTTCRDISDAIVTAIMPCLIFNNIVTNLKSSDIKSLGIIFFTGTLLFAIGVMLAYGISVVTRSPKRWLGGLLSVGLFPNISDLPIAYMQTLSASGNIFTEEEGNKGVAYVCIFLASQVFYQFSLGLYRLVEWDFRDELSEADLEEGKEKRELSSSASPEPRGPPAPPTAAPSIADDSSDTTSIDSDSTKDARVPPASASPRPLVAADQERQQHLAFLRSRSHSIRRTPTADSHHSTVSSNYLSLQLTGSNELRPQRSQDIRDVINEYSSFDGLRLMRTSTPRETAVSPPQEAATVATKPGRNWRATFIQVGKNFLAPNSVSLIMSIAIAMSPPLKKLFVHTGNGPHIPDAPDGQPPLSFVMDFVAYVGAASVPLGLLLLGATMSRLQVKRMPPGFWKTALGVTLGRLVILPIIGVGITTGFYKGGWYGDDDLLRFVSVLEFGLPSATALVYFTAFYTNPHSEDHLQMDCLAVCLIFQYSIVFISLPFLVTFTLKVSLGI